MSHTPGPWQAWQEPGNPGLYTVIDASDEFVAWTRDLLKPDDECEANAMLIAAAPDLYQALLGLHLMMSKYPETYQNGLYAGSAIGRQVAEAIAKAGPAHARMAP